MALALREVFSTSDAVFRKANGDAVAVTGVAMASALFSKFHPGYASPVPLYLASGLFVFAGLVAMLAQRMLVGGFLFLAGLTLRLLLLMSLR